MRNWTTVSGGAAPQIVSGSSGLERPARLTALTGVPARSAMTSSLRRPCGQFGHSVRAGNRRPAEQHQGLFLVVRELALLSADLINEHSTAGPPEAKRPADHLPGTDVWRIQAVGPTSSGYQNGNLVVQATDTSINPVVPECGCTLSDQITNWSGGDVATYSVGGTVSGLSGTVVLQDNGGDSLSVTATGGSRSRRPDDGLGL